MTDPHRYAVPMEQLEGVRVAESDLVQEQRTDDHPDASAWNGPQLRPFGDGPGADGE